MSDIWQRAAHHPTPETRDNNEDKMRARREARDNSEEMRARRESTQCEDHQAVMRGDAACNGPEMAPMIVTCHES